jgi:hypothetical protein
MTVSQIIEKIKALEILKDAKTAAETHDFAGLAYIINMACGMRGTDHVKFVMVLDVAHGLKTA